LTQSPEAFADLLWDERVTVLNQTPSAISQLLERAPRTSHLRHIICGGEALPANIAARLRDWHVPVWNFYGPTEATVWSTSYPIESLTTMEGSIPIGRPLGNTEIYLLDEHVNPVPVGIEGGLYVGGAGVALGYRNNPELTAEKFIPNPFESNRGARLYRTGDLARYVADGNIHFLRRIDHQVKIRGFRIELGEIEAVLQRHSALKHAVVVVREDSPGEKALVAYVVAKHASAPSTGELRYFLRQKLPEYMIPAIFVFLGGGGGDDGHLGKGASTEACGYSR
jgi:non-ribosomal peptide synthetase component F